MCRRRTRRFSSIADLWPRTVPCTVRLYRAAAVPASIPGSIRTKQSRSSTRRETAHDRVDRRIHPRDQQQRRRTRARHEAAGGALGPRARRGHPLRLVAARVRSAARSDSGELPARRARRLFLGRVFASGDRGEGSALAVGIRSNDNEAGFSGYLKKPVEPIDLAQKLHGLLHSDALTSERAG